MNISSDRIEAASEPMRMKYCRSTNCTASNCECRAMTRLILTADAPALAAAESRGRIDGKVDGLVEAGRMISGYRETVPGREPGPLAQIDARIAAIQAEKDETT